MVGMLIETSTLAFEIGPHTAPRQANWIRETFIGDEMIANAWIR
jgi:hypothetical protein